jgi:hypothetical protein
MEGFKNKTTAGTDGVNTELFKYAFQKVSICFTDLASIQDDSQKDGVNLTVNGTSTHARQLVVVFQVLCSL